MAQIAAGEVIERPVSVVKELVENSLDAGASHVWVELADGGRDAISVKDDGSGIAADDLKVALARHATSKLHSPDDLYAVTTLGFRGEGLASVAAAGALELTSRRADQEFGAHVQACAAAIGEVATVAAPVGTKVVVRDLFDALPARREYLKSPQAELSRISSLLSRLALGWPAVGFALRNDGREVWALPPARHSVDRIEAVFGKAARGALREIVFEETPQRERVRGHVSATGSDRPSRQHQVFFVNRRLVRSSSLSAAWLAGHGSSSMVGRYPFGMISIDLPAQDIDVNVHPTKVEVRFAHAAQVFDTVRRAVARTLRAPAVGTYGPGTQACEPALTTASSQLEFSPTQTAPEMSLFPDAAAAVRVLGQVDRTYVLATDGNEVLILDQHAAHERIAYEAIVASAGRGDGAATLLFPTIVELTPDQAATFHEFEREFSEAGVIVERFGHGAYRICGVPSGYERRGFDFAKMLDDLTADDAPREGLGRRNRVLATVACHSVVRAHQTLTSQEQSALYERLLHCRDPHTCPHGRPTIVRLDAAALAKTFKRV
ncbi:MAG: DNA mismatch repair endonuclease MutL [Candidatus Eremiobacteraeota bacterium]|nr:DNA mismatch repair endonuclease MutL [Candidatus Eremiobacteraeota bacterium]